MSNIHADLNTFFLHFSHIPTLFRPFLFNYSLGYIQHDTDRHSNELKKNRLNRHKDYQVHKRKKSIKSIYRNAAPTPIIKNESLCGHNCRFVLELG